MFNTLDSQPQEWLLHQPALLHTIAVCSFGDSAHARRWIHELVPRDKNRRLLKWSGGARKPQRTRERRVQFIEAVERRYEEIDFAVHCISSTEAEISECAQAFYLQNLEAMGQEKDHKDRNSLTFKINKEKTVRIPVLRAARLIWVYWCIKYLKEVHGLEGFIFSDWFAGDTLEGEDPALAVGIVNLLLDRTGVGLQLSIPNEAANAEADLLSDWFAGWSNSSRSGTVEQDIAARFEYLLERQPEKVSWINFRCHVELRIMPE